MKKIVLPAIVIACTGGAVFAQDATSAGTSGGIKPTAGEYSIEANVNLLGGSVNLSNSLQQIRGRYFLSDDMAVRLGANLSIESRTENPDKDTEIKYSHFGISLMPGIEKHFAGTERLSPYVGAELGIGIDTRKRETTEDGNKIEVTGSWGDGRQRGYFQVGLNAIAGCDFYVARHLYLGYELGFGLNIKSESKIEANGEEVDGKSGSFTLGPNVRNGIRVGFVF